MSPEAGRITVGIVGAGEVVSGVHLPVLSAMRARVCVEYVADISAIAASRVGTAYQSRAVALNGNLDQLPVTDVVLIATPVGVRDSYYELFASRGTAVLAEKPAVRDLSELHQLQRIYPAERFAVGFQRRTYASSVLVEQLIRDETLGPLRDVTVQEGARTTGTGGSQGFMEDPSLSGGGILMDLGSHGIDLACQLSLATASTVKSAAGLLDEQVDREVDLTVTLETPRGSVELDVGLSWLDFRAGTTRFGFDRGAAVVSSKPGQPVRLLSVDDEVIGELLPPAGPAIGALTVHQACYLVWESFLDGLAGISPPRLGLATISPAVQLIESSYREIRGTS